MSEIEITLPTVQFGNVKVRATPEELGVNDISDSYELGVVAAVYLNLFQQGFKHGATLDVSAPQGASQGAPGPRARTIDEVLSDEDVDTVAEAQAILDKGLGGVTELPDEEFERKAAAAEAEMGDKAPWEQRVDAPRKPWETEVTAPAVLDASW